MLPLGSPEGTYRALRTLQAPEQVAYDPLEKRWRVSSGAFKMGRDRTFSVDLEEALLRDGQPLTYGYPRVGRAVGLVAHTVDRLTTDGLRVNYTPMQVNDYHGSVSGKVARSIVDGLATDCEVIEPINGDETQRLTNERLAKEAIAASSVRGQG